MKPLSFALLLLAWPALAGGAEKPQDKPVPLAAKEIADGWIALFDGQTTFGWQVEGDVKVEGGALVFGGKDRTVVNLDFGYFDLSWEHRVDGPATGSPQRLSTATKEGVVVGKASTGFSRSSKGGAPTWVKERWKVEVDPNGKAQAVINTKGGSATGLESEALTTLPADCHIATRLEIPAGIRFAVRNVKLKPRGLEPIFNGKDLTGWKEVKTARTRSRFTVTKEGWLNVQDGPGDLQTEGQWADFVLQLECISNGKHLNSGVFFRSLPGQFWSGYEAQIRNQWQGDDRSRPVDYGTGGIYNRQPARKVVSSDNEWFTMTVVARGKHLAVWVNGYQTADFTDKRPANESARKGSKVDRGPISLQGHDKTTNLSFRNLRIVELPRAAK